jgi:hypothetical protein
MEDQNLPDFKGKIVLFYTRNAPRAMQDGLVLEYVTFIRYNNKHFLSGRVPSVDDKGTDWVSNLKAGLAWDEVSHFIIFDTRDDYICRLGGAKVSIFHKIFGR